MLTSHVIGAHLTIESSRLARDRGVGSRTPPPPDNAGSSWAERAAIGRPSADSRPPIGRAPATSRLGAQSGGVRPPALHHVARYTKRDVFLDMRTACGSYTADDRDDFLIDDLGVPIADLLGCLTDSLTKLVRITLRTPEIAAAVLERLQVGIPWTAVGGAKVYGWHPSDAVINVRVSDIPFDFPIGSVLLHMQRFGQVIASRRGRLAGRLGLPDGILHLSMVLNNTAPLPTYIEVDEDGGTAERLTVYSDLYRRRCYRCGNTGHIGQYCRASSRAQGAPASLWSTLRPLPPPALVSGAGRAGAAPVPDVPLPGTASDGRAGAAPVPDDPLPESSPAVGAVAPAAVPVFELSGSSPAVGAALPAAAAVPVVELSSSSPSYSPPASAADSVQVCTPSTLPSPTPPVFPPPCSAVDRSRSPSVDCSRSLRSRSRSSASSVGASLDADADAGFTAVPSRKRTQPRKAGKAAKAKLLVSPPSAHISSESSQDGGDS